MGALDFLFDGTPPKSVTTYGQTTTNVPTWLSDYTQGLISRANQEAANPYQAYTGPRIAGTTGDQNAAYGATRSAVSGGINPQAETLIGNASQQSALGLATPYLDKATETFTGANVDKYMDPYIQNVIDKSTADANRNYTENIMPGITNTFVKAGQFGSSAHEREANQAGRDLTTGLQLNSAALRSGAYQNAGSLFGADASRAASVGQTVGSLGAGDASRQIQAAGAYQDLAANRQNLGLQGAAALDTVGKEQQQQQQSNLDLAYGDFQNQNNYNRNQLDWLSSLIRGVPYSSSTTTSNTGPLPGAQYGPSGGSQAGSVLSGLAGLIDAYKNSNSGD